MKDLIPRLSEAVDDLQDLRLLDDGSVDLDKIDYHIETIEFVIDELTKETK